MCQALPLAGIFRACLPLAGGTEGVAPACAGGPGVEPFDPGRDAGYDAAHGHHPRPRCGDLLQADGTAAGDQCPAAPAAATGRYHGASCHYSTCGPWREPWPSMWEAQRPVGPTTFGCHSGATLFGLQASIDITQCALFCHLMDCVALL